MVSKGCPLAYRLPFAVALVPPDTLEMRGEDASTLHKMDAVLDVVVISQRRGLLRGMAFKVLPLALRPSFHGGLVVAAQVEIESKQ